MKAKSHVLGLSWTSGTTAEAYFERLKAARTALSSKHLVVWNDRDLLSDTKADYLKLIGLMMCDGWGKEKTPMSRQSALADVCSSTWLRLLRGY